MLSMEAVFHQLCFATSESVQLTRKRRLLEKLWRVGESGIPWPRLSWWNISTSYDGGHDALAWEILRLSTIRSIVRSKLGLGTWEKYTLHSAQESEILHERRVMRNYKTLAPNETCGDYKFQLSSWWQALWQARIERVKTWNLWTSALKFDRWSQDWKLGAYICAWWWPSALSVRLSKQQFNRLVLGQISKNFQASHN